MFLWDLRKIITGTTVAAARTTEPPSPSELIAEGHLDEGIAAYRTAKPDAQALNRLGGTFLRLGRYREAVAIFRLATELEPGSSNVWDSLAAALFDTGDFAGAAEATRNALARVDGDTTSEEQAFVTPHRPFATPSGLFIPRHRSVSSRMAATDARVRA